MLNILSPRPTNLHTHSHTLKARTAETHKFTTIVHIMYSFTHNRNKYTITRTFIGDTKFVTNEYKNYNNDDNNNDNNKNSPFKWRQKKERERSKKDRKIERRKEQPTKLLYNLALLEDTTTTTTTATTTTTTSANNTK